MSPPGSNFLWRYRICGIGTQLPGMFIKESKCVEGYDSNPFKSFPLQKLTFYPFLQQFTVGPLFPNQYKEGFKYHWTCINKVNKAK